MNNPFLTQDVYAACTQARVYYLDMLTRLRGTSRKRLETAKKKHGSNLDMYWEQAEQAALTGDVRIARTQLNAIVMEWGIYKAHQDLINARMTYLDPTTDPGTVNDFHRALEHKVVYWVTELMNKWNEGENKRKSDQATMYMDRNQHLFGVQSQIIQNQGNALGQAHQYNKQYADAGLRGAYQAQEAAQWVMQNASSMYAEVQQSLRENLKAQQATTETIEQNQPREKERAQARMQMRSCLTRGCLVVLLMLVCPAAFGLAYLILTLVVLNH